MPRQLENHTGKKFGRLTVLGLHGRSGPRNLMHWSAQCECGNTLPVLAALLKRGTTRECVPCQDKQPVEVKWEFNAPTALIGKVVRQLQAGATTVTQLQGAVSKRLDPLMDCIAVLQDQGRINVRYNETGDRLYTLANKKTYPTYTSPEMGIL